MAASLRSSLSSLPRSFAPGSPLAGSVKVVLRLHLDGTDPLAPSLVQVRAAPASALWHPLRLGGGAFVASLIRSNEKRSLRFVVRL